MARSYVNVRAQHGNELTAGVAVAAPNLFGSAKVTVEPKQEREAVTSQGSRFATTVYTKKEWTEGKLEGVPSYTEAASLFNWAYGPAITLPSGAGWSHTFVLSPSVPTKTLEFGDETEAASVAGVFVSGLSLTWGRNSGDAQIGADLVGGLWNDNATLTADAVAPVARPVEPGHVCVYLDDTFGTLGTTKVSDALAVTIDFSELRGPDWKLDCSLPSLAGSVEMAPKAEIELMIEASAEGRALLAALRSGATKYLRVEATGPVIDGADRFKLTLDFAVQVSEHGRSEQDGVYVSSTKLQVVEDVDGFSHLVEVIDDAEQVA